MFRILFLFILALSTFQVNGQKIDSLPYPMKNNAVLWEISGPGVKKNCYVFGTMHLLEEAYFIFPKKLEKIVQKSELLVMELAGMPNQFEVLKFIQLKEGDFFDYFTKEQEDSIIEWANNNLKISEAAFRSTFSKMKPFAVVQAATQIQFLGKTVSYELKFEEIARSNNIQLKGLETIQQQMALFDSLSDNQQVEMVMENIRNGVKSELSMRSLQEMYSRQNVDSLHLLIASEGGLLADEYTRFIDDRNAKWIPAIEIFIKESNTFIAVGAGHLGGPNGLIRLLMKEGYTLTPITL